MFEIKNRVYTRKFKFLKTAAVCKKQNKMNIYINIHFYLDNNWLKLVSSIKVLCIKNRLFISEIITIITTAIFIILFIILLYLKIKDESI